MKIKTRSEKKTGVWLDEKIAYVITMSSNAKPEIQEVNSEVELMERYPGEKKPYAQFGTTYSNEERRKQRRQKQEREYYFEKLINAVHDADSIYLFGPGQAKKGLRNAIEKDHTIHAKLIAMETTDRLTKNQMLERVTEYYNGLEYGKKNKGLQK